MIIQSENNLTKERHQECSIKPFLHKWKALGISSRMGFLKQLMRIVERNIMVGNRTRLCVGEMRMLIMQLQ